MICSWRDSKRGRSDRGGRGCGDSVAFVLSLRAALRVKRAARRHPRSVGSVLKWRLASMSLTWAWWRLSLLFILVDKNSYDVWGEWEKKNFYIWGVVAVLFKHDV